MASNGNQKTQLRPRATEAPSPYARYVEADAEKPEKRGKAARGKGRSILSRIGASRREESYDDYADYEPYEDYAGEPYANEPYADEPADEPEDELMLDRYRVVETRATGGFGEVDVCWDTRLQRRVAIKRIPLFVDEDSEMYATSIEDAIAEARTASMLSHPNIVTVYDFETDGQYAYLVMEYVNGLSLSELLQRVEGGVLSFDEASHVLASVAQALSFAHENGVLHLDIKPANILIDRSGTVKLSDFGMAALASAAGYGGARGGTVGYMSPEQIVGDYVDERSDIFSLAVVIWQALTHESPFLAPTARESLTKIGNGPATRLSKMEPELAGPVEIGLLNALSYDPTPRTADASRFAAHICPELGDTAAGQTSLRRLLDQLADDEGAVFGFEYEHIPLAERFPALGDILIRLASAVCCGWFGWALGAPVAELLPKGHLLVPGVMALLGLAFPTMSALAVGILLVADFVLSKTSVAFPVQTAALMILTAFVFLVWRFGAGLDRRLSTAALLAPSVLQAPFAGVGLSGYALPPLAAGATAALGWAGSRVVALILEHNYDVALIVDGIAKLLRTPTTWIALLSCVLLAIVVSLLSHRRSLPLAILAQIIAFTGIVLVNAYFIRVENGGIWNALQWKEVPVALALSVSLSLASFIFGAPGADLEVD